MYKEIKEYYNNGQDEFENLIIDGETVVLWQKGHLHKHVIGFYEWLFNPKYKVFEVFGQKKQVCSDCWKEENEYCVVNAGQHSYMISKSHALAKWCIGKQSQEILDYFKQQIKS
jgi:hypothetical protein